MKYFGIIAIALSMCIQLYSQVPTNGLIVWYPLRSDASDASGNGNNGIINEGVTWRVELEHNPPSAANFDGRDGMIKSMRPIEISGYSPRTLTCWINLERLQDMSCILGWGTVGHNGGLCYLKEQNGRLFFHGHYMDLSGGTINPFEWHMVTMTYDGNYAKLYLDEELVDGSSCALKTETTILHIGFNPDMDDGGFNRHLKGRIVNVLVYDRSLAPTEIATLHSQTDPRVRERSYHRDERTTGDYKASESKKRSHSSVQLMTRIDVVINKFNIKDINTSNTVESLLKCKYLLEKDDSQTSINKVEDLLTNAQRLLEAIEDYKVQEAEHFSQFNEMKRKGINTSFLEQEHNDVKNALEQGNTELAQKVMSGAREGYVIINEAYQSLQLAEEEVNQVKNLGGDVSSALGYLNDARDELNKSNYSGAINKSHSAASIAHKSVLGKVNLRELNALAIQYDTRSIRISGKAVEIQMVYGSGYRMTVDDGTGLSTVLFNGSLKEIKSGDEVNVEGVFSKNLRGVVASRVEKSVLSMDPKIMFGIGMIIFIVVAEIFRRKRHTRSV